LGCSTRNGLEHINPLITQNVFAIDFNQEYLKIVEQRFSRKINGLKILKTDLNIDELQISNIDLIFAGLILEYIEIENVLPKIAITLSNNGTLAIVIQKSQINYFVTKTHYKSLEKLSATSKEIEESDIQDILITSNIELKYKEEIILTKDKTFIFLIFKFKNK